MAEANAEIAYTFHLTNGRTERIGLSFDPAAFLLRYPEPAIEEEWTRLDFHVCGHCPLAVASHPRCPFARALGVFIHRFDTVFSYEAAVVEVTTAQRTVVTSRPLQDAMASIVGLVGATSGCPHLAFFRPMARFHLPFATEQETLVRAFSLHLLGEYVRSGGTGHVVLDVEALEGRYRAVTQVNRGMADRIRAAFPKDAVVNAIVILDTFAQAVPFVVRKALGELRPLFELTPES